MARRRNYVVGFLGEDQVAYGSADAPADNYYGYTFLMNITEARKRLRDLTRPRVDTRRIFRLVAVEKI